MTRQIMEAAPNSGRKNKDTTDPLFEIIRPRKEDKRVSVARPFFPEEIRRKFSRPSVTTRKASVTNNNEKQRKDRKARSSVTEGFFN